MEIIGMKLYVSGRLLKEDEYSFDKDTGTITLNEPNPKGGTAEYYLKRRGWWQFWKKKSWPVIKVIYRK